MAMMIGDGALEAIARTQKPRSAQGGRAGIADSVIAATSHTERRS
jgi:hypothetical protein